jgi:flagellar motor switch protein FliM
MDPRVVQAVQAVPVEVVAELGRVQLGLRRVLSLRPGEVLRLKAGTDDPVQVRVAGLTKLYGVPVISRGQISVQITRRHGE